MVFEIWNLFCENIVFQQNTNLDLSSIFYNKQICNKNVSENARVCFSDILVNKSWIPCLVLRERKSSLSILTSYRLNLWKGFLAAAFSVRKKKGGLFCETRITKFLKAEEGTPHQKDWFINRTARSMKEFRVCSLTMANLFQLLLTHSLPEYFSRGKN